MKKILSIFLFLVSINSIAQSLQQEFNASQSNAIQAKNNSDHLDYLANNINTLGSVYKCEDLKMGFVETNVFIDWGYGFRKQDSYKITKTSNSYSWKIVSLLTGYGTELAYKHVSYEFIPSTSILLLKIETKTDKGKDYTFIQPKEMQGVTKHECTLLSSPQSKNIAKKAGSDIPPEVIDLGKNTFSSATQKVDLGKNAITTKQSIGNASADFDQNKISLRVYRTSWAQVAKNLGNISGKVTISFDWAIKSDGWWEEPAISIISGKQQNFNIQRCDSLQNSSVCGIVIASPNDGGLPIKEFGSTSGRFDKSIDVNGETSIIFFIKPSSHSANGDHGNTLFTIQNLKISN